MNVLQILPELVVGGVETGTVDFASYLVKKGHKSVVVSNGGPLVDALSKAGVKHYCLPVHKKSLFSILACVRQLDGILKKEDIQIVHARSRVPAIIAAVAARRLASMNSQGHTPIFITTCHGYYGNHIFSRPMTWGKFVIVSSNIIARHMMDDFNIAFERIKFIPRGVDLEKFNFTPPSERHNANTVIGIIGRITPIKGHDFFIMAAARMLKAQPKAKILIIGQPPEGKEEYKKQLESLVEKLGISKSVEFMPTTHDMPKALYMLDILVMPSIGHEAFGRVVVEAQAAGVPVIATRVGGLTDVITDRHNGILVSPGDVMQLSDAMLELGGDRDLAEKLANNARQEVEEWFTLASMADKTISVYQEALDKIRILVIKLGAVGDVVLVGPSLRAIRERFPKAHITVLVGIDSRYVLQNCPYIDELIIYNRPFIKKNFLNFKKLAGNLRKLGFDIIIDFQNNCRSHLLAFLSLASKRFGYRNKKLGFLLNYGIKDIKAGLTPVEHQFRVLNLLGINLKDDKLELWPKEEDYKFIDEFLAGQWLMPGQPLIGLNIGGSVRWRTKRWPKDKLLEICRRLSVGKMRVVLTGAKHDKGLASAIAESAVSSKPINAAGKTSLNQLAALIKRCAVFISLDSAPLHIASAVGVPTVAIFGPTDPKRHMPPGENTVVIKKDLKCGPCYKPTCRGLRCMEEIDVDDIMKAVDKLIL